MNCRYLLSLLVAATCSLNVQAASSDGDRWFDVEILVFKRNVDIQKISEQLDQKNVYLKKREQLDLFKAEQVADCLAGEVCLHKKNPVEITKAQIVNNQRIKLLKSSHWKLKEQLLKLDEHELFKPLIHAAWRMPIQNQQNAIPIHLFAGENYALDTNKKLAASDEQNETNNADTSVAIDENAIAAIEGFSDSTALEPEETKNELDVLASLQKQKTRQDLYEIDGNLLIYVERYLYVDSQLIVRTETAKEISTETSLTIQEEVDEQETPAVEIVNQESIAQHAVETTVTESLFDQKRRLRSEEIHYLDHPLFGIIVQIRKIPAKELVVLDAKSAIFKARKDALKAKQESEAKVKKVTLTQ